MCETIYLVEGKNLSNWGDLFKSSTKFNSILRSNLSLFCILFKHKNHESLYIVQNNNKEVTRTISQKVKCPLFICTTERTTLTTSTKKNYQLRTTVPKMMTGLNYHWRIKQCRRPVKCRQLKQLKWILKYGRKRGKEQKHH